MQLIADLQLHSKYSRAVSKDMTLAGIHTWAKRKGIDLIATGDWTHPLWMKEIVENLEEQGNGLLRLKTSESGPLFVLATEVSCIYTQGAKGRRIHTLIWVPTLDAAQKINREMTKRGCNLLSDGRPIIGLTSIEVAELVFSIEEKALVIPAHAWTPWFGAYGSMSGFDSLSDQFGPYADRIYAVETGLSSNPSMNWQIKELDQRAIVSFSDAHSGPKLGREATVFEFEGSQLSPPVGGFSYQHLYDALRAPSKNAKIAYTIEFYPEEGKYHFTGHRACNIRWGPEETRTKGTTCPVCGKPLTQGVVQRISELASRTEADLQLTAISRPLSAGGAEVKMISSKKFPKRPPFIMLVALQEIIAECIGSSVISKKTQAMYTKLIDHFHNEFTVLLHASEKDIAAVSGERIAAGVTKVRSGDIFIDPGYDGVFGVVKLWQEGEEKPLIDASKEQLSLL